MKIRQIIVLLFVVLSVFPMVFLGCISVEYYNNKLEQVLENDLKNTVSIQIEAIVNFMDERRMEATVISQLQLVSNLLRAANNRDLRGEAELRPFVENSFLLRMENRNFIESVTIIDKNFVVLASSTSTAYGKDSVLKNMDSRYFGPEITFTPVLEILEEEKPRKVIVGIQGIYVDGELSGYLVMELNLSFFEKLRISSEVYNNGTVYLIDQEGGLITAGDTHSSREQYELSSTERSGYTQAWNARDKSQTEGVLKYKARGDSYLSYYKDIPSLGWRMISSVNADEVLQTKEGYKQLLWIILTVLVILLVSVNAIIAMNLGTPIQNMVKKFKEIRRKQDYSIRMDETIRNEMGVIAVEINHLLAGIEESIQKERRIQTQLRELANHDPLTGLYNKKAIEQLLERELRVTARDGKQLACVYVDIDDFKEFNTNYGHIGGDQVLQFVAGALEESLNGYAGRVGGDEFLVCVPDAADKSQIEGAVRKFLDIVARGVPLKESSAQKPEGERMKVTCSVGIAFSDGSDFSSDLIYKADLAMYKIKGEEKNWYHIFE